MDKRFKQGRPQTNIVVSITNITQLHQKWWTYKFLWDVAPKFVLSETHFLKVYEKLYTWYIEYWNDAILIAWSRFCETFKLY